MWDRIPLVQLYDMQYGRPYVRLIVLYTTYVYYQKKLL